MKKAIFILLFFVLLYTRLVGIGWGLPYSLHPDELKMSYAVLDISATKLYTPYFWAYGGFHINIVHLFLSLFPNKLDLVHAVLGLRLLSAFFSIWSVLIAIKIVALFQPRSRTAAIITAILFIFSPALIQFAHFGTTESILAWSYLVVIYYSLHIINVPKNNRSLNLYFAVIVAVGIGAATKILALSYLAIFFITIFYIRINKIKQKNQIPKIVIQTLLICAAIGVGAVLVTVALSPHYVTQFKDFIGPLLYEKKLGSGEIVAFYTRQFTGTRPILFQLISVFPYALGTLVMIFATMGIILSPSNLKNNVLRGALFIYAVPMLFLFTKWTRNLAPIFPILLIFAALIISALYESKTRLTKYGITIIISWIAISGVAFLSIYHNPDVRQVASEWIYNNIPAGSTVLSETANGIDVPTQFNSSSVIPKSYNLSALDLYVVDENELTRKIFYDTLNNSDYIIIPSRRVFMNHTCLNMNGELRIGFEKNRCEKLKKMYPILNKYYDALYSGQLGFKQVAFFSSYPRFTLFGKTIMEFPDENAEETWTVFDHPSIRIFKRI